MNHKTTVIFDMDGVIFDSETMYMNELMAFFKNNDIDLSLEQCKQVIGVDNRKFREIVFGWWNEKTSREEFNDILSQYYASLKRNYLAILNPYIFPLLEYLKTHNYKIALASSSSCELIHFALSSSKLEDYFDLITSGNQFKQSKPNPEIYLYTIEQLKVSKKETIIIEDSFWGIQAGNNAQIDVIALKDKKFGMDQSHAKLIVDKLIDIIDYLEKK